MFFFVVVVFSSLTTCIVLYVCFWLPPQQQIMRDRWMNVGYEEEELKPYIEPQPDYKDPRRTGMQLNIQKRLDLLFIVQLDSCHAFVTFHGTPMFTFLILNSFCADVMLQMGYSQEEIKDSLVNQKYNEVMATYLLLDYKNSEVQAVPHTQLLSFLLKTDVKKAQLSV